MRHRPGAVSSRHPNRIKLRERRSRAPTDSLSHQAAYSRQSPAASEQETGGNDRRVRVESVGTDTRHRQRHGASSQDGARGDAGGAQTGAGTDSRVLSTHTRSECPPGQHRPWTKVVWAQRTWGGFYIGTATDHNPKPVVPHS